MKINKGNLVQSCRNPRGRHNTFFKETFPKFVTTVTTTKGFLIRRMEAYSGEQMRLNVEIHQWHCPSYRKKFKIASSHSPRRNRETSNLGYNTNEMSIF